MTVLLAAALAAGHAAAVDPAPPTPVGQAPSLALSDRPEPIPSAGAPDADAARGSSSAGVGVGQASGGESSGGEAWSRERSLPLGPVGDAERADAGAGAGGSASSWASDLFDQTLVRTLASLAFVIACVFVLKWVISGLSRRGGFANQLGAGGRAPAGLMQVLGRYPAARGVTLVLLKLDSRVLLLSQTAAGFTSLCEITDAEDVASILRQVRDAEGDSMSARFSKLLMDVERDPRTAGGVMAPVQGEPATEPIVEPRGPLPAEGEADLRRRLESLRGLAAR